VLAEVQRARRVQAPKPQISGPNLQENKIIEACKEEGRAVSTQEKTLRGLNGRMGHLTRSSAPCTDSRPYPQIANQLAGSFDYNANI
jgi:hypothetical protein